MKSWLIGVVSLVIGAVIGFMYAQGDTDKVKQQLSAAQTEMSEKVAAAEKKMAEKVSGLEDELAKAKKAAQGAAAQLTTFKNDVGEKAKMIDELKAKIKQLETSAAATPPPAAPAAPASPPASSTPPPPGQPGTTTQ